MSSGSDGRVPAAGAWTPALRWRRVFPGEARELAALRRFLAVLLPECAARDDVMCVATELSSNALRHTVSGRGGRFAVEIVWDTAAVHLAVSDGGAPSGPRVVDDPRQENGRGLLLVRALSRSCGACGDQRGRVVWADVPWADAEAASLGRRVAAVGDGGEIWAAVSPRCRAGSASRCCRAAWPVPTDWLPWRLERATRRCATRSAKQLAPDSGEKDRMTELAPNRTAGRTRWPLAWWLRAWAVSARGSESDA
jgi:serine/threonine-protein kinase RsbW